MKPPTFMLIAGEASGDLLAAELVSALRDEVVARDTINTSDVQPLRTALAPRFIGAGGQKMAAAGVNLEFDLTQHSVIGLSEVLKNYLTFRRLFQQLLRVAIEQQPDYIIGVDYGGFNLRFGAAIRNHVRKHRTEFTPWNPKIIQFVSPQVWASRPGRAYTLQDNYDLLLSIFPFETDWYARRTPHLRVEFVGHPMVGRYGKSRFRKSKSESGNATHTVLLLPGSRAGELQRHLPVMLGALKMIRQQLPGSRAVVALPNETLAQQANALDTPADVEIQVGNLPQWLSSADLAIASTGTVTMECALFGVPTVTLYKTSWSTYQIGKRIVSVKWLTMPNILADEEVFPEFVQNAATPQNISAAAISLLQDVSRRDKVKARLASIVTSLGDPGATARAAQAILNLSA